jgi:hypothetical protein
LVLQNDPVYVEAARCLAERCHTSLQGEQGTDERLVFAFRLVLSRRPSAAELAELQKIHQQARERYAADAKAAKQLVGQRDLPAGATPADWAAWFSVSHVLLNLDETITKN